ncbi:methyltransferase domain-containing protein [Parvibaculaceae bacterium PLY_AMNH_Bact1]|nr:methyltransferase domain-containing protein [Parvibaculaceae bacterium PLY_AMNH_Bact1]
MSSDAQYQRDINLATRIAFHEDYTEPYVDFSYWVLDKLPLPDGARVLELGCGNGEFWARNVTRIPKGLDLVLTDSSAGMVEAAEQKLSAAGIAATYQVASAEDVPADEEGFDLILAKHMLYHVADRPKALSVANSLLKPSGYFCATTNSSSYMQQLQALMTDQGLEWFSSFTDEFTLENGAEQLAQHFGSVELEVLDGQLIVPNAKAIVEYIKSTASLFPEPDLVLEACELVRSKVQAVIEREGVFTISKQAGVFLCH